MPVTRHVFISFASADIALAHRAVEAFERAGIQCWIADRDITAGGSYPAAITSAIKGSHAFLLLLTDAANASPHVLREVELAFTARRPLLPVCVAGARPSSDLQYFLSTSQWFDAGRDLDEGDLATITPALKDLIDRGKSGGLVSHERWRTWRAPAAIVLLITAVALALIWFQRGPSQAPAPAASGSPQRLPDPADDRQVTSAPPSIPAAPSTDTATRPPAPATTPERSPRARLNPRDGQTYVWIAPGAFAMGCSDGDGACDADEKPVREVEIPRGFWLARTEVTNAQYRRLVGRAGDAADRPDDVPITEVDWPEARAYCSRVAGRLPTEAEWEYAARGGTRARYYGPLNTIAWFGDNSDERVHPVAGKTPNRFGLYDMLGNASEWVLDRYYNAYDDTSDPLTPDLPLAGNASAVARGGSWISEAAGVRVSRRLDMPPDAQEPHIGFRCALDR